MIEEITELCRYNSWANRRMLAAVSKLSDENVMKDMRSSFPSVRDTFQHILAGEWLWFSRLKGISPTQFPASWDASTSQELRNHWEELDAEFQSFVASLNDERLNAEVEYLSMDGKPFHNLAHELLRHLVNHSTYHRGQITTLIRQLGGEPAGSDLLYFYREKNQ